MSRQTLLNIIGGGLIGLAYLFSAIWVIRITLEERAPEDGGSEKRVVRLMHWQLEPGYREAMQRVMDAYNALPHVQEAQVEMRQLDITERVYAQVLNVQLISGTAADICEKGMGQLSGGESVSQYFEPLESYVLEPNPYNQAPYLPAHLPKPLQHALQTRAWRDTLIDGMQGGWDESLQNYYAIPTSVLGGLRIYYNRDLIGRTKQLLREAIERSPRPAWYQELLLSEDGTQGYLTEDETFRAWIRSDAAPQTLGQFFAISLGIKELARIEDNPRLVPVAGSSYSDMMFAGRFMVPFTAHYAESINFDQNQNVDGLETWLAWQMGLWSFEDPQVRGYFECLRAICEQFPPGFVGLDREQARRRFVSGQAAMIATGVWDARSIFDSAEGVPVTEENPARRGEPITVIDGEPWKNHHFQVGLAAFPLPAEGERWFEYIAGPANEARTSANGGPYAVFQRSRNKAWAIDFLRYLTSYAVNEPFNREAGWLPCIIGTQPSERMEPFLPNPRGINASDHLAFTDARSGAIRTRYQGQLKRYLSGEITYATFVGQVEDMARNDRSGVNRVWHEGWLQDRNAARNYDRLLAVEALRQLYDLEGASDEKIRNPAFYSAATFNGELRRAVWRQVNPDQPFPQF